VASTLQSTDISKIANVIHQGTIKNSSSDDKHSTQAGGLTVMRSYLNKTNRS